MINRRTFLSACAKCSRRRSCPEAELRLLLFDDLGWADAGIRAATSMRRPTSTAYLEGIRFTNGYAAARRSPKPPAAHRRRQVSAAALTTSFRAADETLRACAGSGVRQELPLAEGYRRRSAMPGTPRQAWANALGGAVLPDRQGFDLAFVTGGDIFLRGWNVNRRTSPRTRIAWTASRRGRASSTERDAVLSLPAVSPAAYSSGSLKPLIDKYGRGRTKIPWAAAFGNRRRTTPNMRR
jgi:hypothetical protein